MEIQNHHRIFELSFKRNEFLKCRLPKEYSKHMVHQLYVRNVQLLKAQLESRSLVDYIVYCRIVEKFRNLKRLKGPKLTQLEAKM